MLIEWHPYTTTEQPFVPGHLSWLPLGPGQKVAFVPGPTASRASGGTDAFCPGWRHQPGTKAPLLSRMVAPTGKKAARTFSPGWSYQSGLKVSFSPGSTLHPGQNGSRGHLSSYFTAAPPPSLSSLSLSLLQHFSSSKTSLASL